MGGRGLGGGRGSGVAQGEAIAMPGPLLTGKEDRRRDEGSKGSNGCWLFGVQPLLDNGECRVRVVSRVLVGLAEARGGAGSRCKRTHEG